MTLDGALNGLLKLALTLVVVAAGAFAVLAVLDRLALDQRAAERRALLQRNAELNAGALAPGSVLACLDGGAGETIENACEKSVFADPKGAAGAVAYTGARLALLADAQALAQTDPSVLDAFAAARRAVELDRYGIAAHVLAIRDGCTAERCAAFAWLRDTEVLKANLKADAFHTYVTRYAAAWDKAEPDKDTPVAAVPAPAQAALASAPEPSQPTGHPVSSKYDFPSAASIPPVSIMNAEPPLPKEPAATEGAAPKPAAPPKRSEVQAAPATPPR